MVYAQTILQLNNQMLESAREPRELELVGRAHELTQLLFAHTFRSSGKPFLVHCVRIGSILEAHRMSAELMAAGILHAVYVEGDFGDNAYTATRARRDRVTRTVGSEVEGLIARYTDLLPWSEAQLDAMARRPEGLSDVDRLAAYIRLANELEEALDFAPRYSGKEHKMLRTEYLDRVVALAKALGQTEMADEMTAVFDRLVRAEIPAYLRTSSTGAFRLPQPSYDLKPKIRARRFVGRALRALRLRG